MKFRFKEITWIVYLSIKNQLGDSTEEIATLYDLLDKTSVPVIQASPWRNVPIQSNYSDNSEFQADLKKRYKEWGRVEGKFDEWKKEGEIKKEIEASPIQIDKRIEDLQKEIDAYVFSIFDLGMGEVKEILEDLEVRDPTEKSILRYLKKI